VEISLIIYLCATYLFTGLFIYKNRDILTLYNITPMALIIFLVAPLAAVLAGNDYDITLWVRIFMAILFSIFLLVKGNYRFKLNKGSIKKIITDIILTALLCFIVPVAIHAIRGFPIIDVSNIDTSLVTFNITYIWFFDLSNAAISEEPLFRGLLWGFLKHKGIKDHWICIIQGILFWLGHIYYFGTGVNFWVIHPFLAILLGLLVWKTKSITHSMIFHSSVNTFTAYLRDATFL
jgi:membrane protease YdiL (CAAX protease family)